LVKTITTGKHITRSYVQQSQQVASP
jgi:hypothetical protein